MTTRFKHAVLSVVLSALPGCGLLDASGYCDFRPKEGRCQERQGLPTTLVALEQVCKLAGGTYASGSCPRAGTIGGCDQSEVANPVRDWYYPLAGKSIQTADDVKKECAGKTYLAP